MGIQSCCLRPEEKRVEISSPDQENDNEIPQDSQQINNIEANNQLENQQINQQVTSSKVGNIQEMEVNHNENEQIEQSANIQNDEVNNNINQEAINSPQQNEENEEQMEEQGEEAREEGDEEEEQVVEVHEEVEIEDVPLQQGAKNEEELINPLDQLGDTVAQTKYINNQDNNNINNSQEELNRIFNVGGNQMSNSHVTFNDPNQVAPIISTASAEGAFDLNQLSMQQSGINANYYGMTSSVPAPISNEDINQFLNNANNENYDLNNNNTEQFDLNNLNMDTSNNNVEYSTYGLGIASQTVNYNNDINSLGINANAGSGEAYEIHGGNTSSTLTFGGQGENNYQNFENAQVSNVVENSTYAIPGQSVSFNYSYTVPASSTLSQY